MQKQLDRVLRWDDPVRLVNVWGGEAAAVEWWFDTFIIQYYS